MDFGQILGIQKIESGSTDKISDSILIEAQNSWKS